VDLKVEKVLNDNTDTLKGGIFHYYVDIESWCKIDDIEMDDDRICLNGVLNQSIDLGFRNVNIESITTRFGNTNLEFN
jgi:hypothetical protein